MMQEAMMRLVLRLGNETEEEEGGEREHVDRGAKGGETDRTQQDQVDEIEQRIERRKRAMRRERWKEQRQGWQDGTYEVEQSNLDDLLDTMINLREKAMGAVKVIGAHLDLQREEQEKEKPIQEFQLQEFSKELVVEVPQSKLRGCTYFRKQFDGPWKTERSQDRALEFPNMKLLDGFYLALCCFADPNQHPVDSIDPEDLVGIEFQVHTSAGLLELEDLQTLAEGVIMDNMELSKLYKAYRASEKYGRENFKNMIFRWLTDQESCKRSKLLRFTPTKIGIGRKNSIPCAVFSRYVRDDILRKQKYFLPLQDKDLQQCYIERKRSMGRDGKQVHFIIKDENTNEILLSVGHYQGANDFYFSTEYPPQRRFGKVDVDFLAHVRCDFLGSTFVIYDHGIPSQDEMANSFPELIRGEHGVVVYDRNVLARIPNAMTVLLPSGNSSDGKSIVDRYYEDDLVGIDKMRTVKPIWHAGYESWTLDFKGRVKLASKKNFQLGHPMNSPDTNSSTPWLMQFGKVSKHRFSLDFRSPLTIIQATSIALTTFADKLMMS